MASAKNRPRLRASSTSRWVDEASKVSGFSHSTGLPDWKQRRTSTSCRPCGVAT
jgi:hypothetical protein